ncbi:Gfo/Idh/MocA family oxidoreductase [candidate division KSB1 bacterium]|nr:Gfo/Idh/MocA family oxidoreductase [candidate division KSB1 bacterium]
MTRVKVGVIGVGRLGQHHARLYRQLETARLIGVFDADWEVCQGVAVELKILAFRQMEDLLNQVDAVSVATPTATHGRIGRLVLQAGVHIFIEKPIADTLATADDLINQARKRGLKIQVGHIERFNPALLALRGVGLEPRFIESHRLATFDPRGTDVAVVLDLMIHDLDIIINLVKSPIRRIDANGVNVLTDSIDIANARLTFDNGCVANVTASRISQKKMRKMRLFQRDVYISVDFLDGISEIFRLEDVHEGLEKTPSIGVIGEYRIGGRKKRIVYNQPQVPGVNALQLELEGFLKAVAGGGDPPVTGEDGRRALEVAMKVIEEIERQNQKVTF